MTQEVFLIDGKYDLAKAKETISEKLNESWIEKRKQGNTTLSYIGGHIVIRLLNKAFNYQWSYEIVSEEIVESLPKPVYSGYGQNKKPVMIKLPSGEEVQKLEPQAPVVKVKGRLTVPGLGVKEQYGSKVLIGGATEQESAFKSASTDALKKCASLFGIGLELYGEAEGFEEKAYQEYASNPAPQSAPVNIPPYQQPQTQVPQEPVQQNFQTAAQAQEQGSLAVQEQGTVLQPNVQEAPQQEAVTATPARTFAWPPSEVVRLRELKEKLGVPDNSHLDPYVREFLNNPEVTIQNITPDNITAFNVFLNSKLS